MLNLEELAGKLYHTHWEALDWTDFDGEQMPTWIEVAKKAYTEITGLEV